LPKAPLLDLTASGADPRRIYAPNRTCRRRTTPCYTEWDAYLDKGSPKYRAAKAKLEAKLKAVQHIVDYYYRFHRRTVPKAKHAGNRTFIELADQAFEVDAGDSGGPDDDEFIERITQHCACDGIRFTTLYDLVSLLDLKDAQQCG
jgi:hypothetical protein